MAKFLTGQATGSKTQEIKRMLLTLLEIPAGQHGPPPLPLRPASRNYFSPGHHFNWSSSGSKGQS